MWLFLVTVTLAAAGVLATDTSEQKSDQELFELVVLRLRGAKGDDIEAAVHDINNLDTVAGLLYCSHSRLFQMNQKLEPFGVQVVKTCGNGIWVMSKKREAALPFIRQTCSRLVSAARKRKMAHPNEASRLFPWELLAYLLTFHSKDLLMWRQVSKVCKRLAENAIDGIVFGSHEDYAVALRRFFRIFPGDTRREALQSYVMERLVVGTPGGASGRASFLEALLCYAGKPGYGLERSIVATTLFKRFVSLKSCCSSWSPNEPSEKEYRRLFTIVREQRLFHAVEPGLSGEEMYMLSENIPWRSFLLAVASMALPSPATYPDARQALGYLSVLLSPEFWHAHAFETLPRLYLCSSPIRTVLYLCCVALSLTLFSSLKAVAARNLVLKAETYPELSGYLTARSGLQRRPRAVSAGPIEKDTLLTLLTLSKASPFKTWSRVWRTGLLMLGMYPVCLVSSSVAFAVGLGRHDSIYTHALADLLGLLSLVVVARIYSGLGRPLIMSYLVLLQTIVIWVISSHLF